MTPRSFPDGSIEAPYKKPQNEPRVYRGKGGFHSTLSNELVLPWRRAPAAVPTRESFPLCLRLRTTTSLRRRTYPSPARVCVYIVAEGGLPSLTAFQQRAGFPGCSLHDEPRKRQSSRFRTTLFDRRGRTLRRVANNSALLGIVPKTNTGRAREKFHFQRWRLDGRILLFFFSRILEATRLPQ